MVDLRSDPRALFVLLDDTHEWRERVVEELTINDGDHVSFTSSFQLRIQPDRFTPLDLDLHDGQEVRLVVPLTTRPKELLLDVSLKTGDGRSCALLLKEQTAALQTDYISWVLGERLTPLVWNLLYGVSAHNVDGWKEFESAYTAQERLRRFLDDGVRHFDVSISQVRNWNRIIRQAEIDLESALDEPHDPYSAAGNLLRAIPYVAQLDDPETVGSFNTPNDVRLALEGIATLVSSCSQQSRSLIAEYGRRWEVLVDLTVRLGEPVQVQLATKRLWSPDGDHDIVQRFSVGDAKSAHIEARIADHGVVFDERPVLTDMSGRLLGVPVVNSMRHTDDTASVYASDMKGQRYYVDLKMKLALRPSIERALAAVQLSLVLAVVATFVIPTTAELADNLALLVLPLTLVGAIVLTRESTAVAQRLQEDRRRNMVWLVSVLWVVAGIRIMGAAFDSTWPWDSWESFVDVIRFW
jgi:hypothetical protein